MKMQPIVFQERFSNGKFQEDISEGFTSFQDELGFHDERVVEIEPTTWKQGSCLRVRIFDRVCPEKSCASTVFPTSFTKEIRTLCIYDYSPSQDTSLYILPTGDQAMLISALASGDIRGLTAELMVRNLFIDLCIMNPKFEMEKFLPEVFQYWRNHYERYRCKINSK